MNLTWIDAAGITHSVTAPDDAPPASLAARLTHMAYDAVDRGEHVGAVVLSAAANRYRLEATRQPPATGHG